MYMINTVYCVTVLLHEIIVFLLKTVYHIKVIETVI